MRAFHIDRLGHLEAGMTLALQNIEKIIGGQVGGLLAARHPSGLSQHGITYMASKQQEVTRGNTQIESMLEYERILHFSGLPSRFESLFACDTEENLRLWLQKLKGPTKPMIWEIDIEHKNFLLLDTSLINFNNQPLIHATLMSHQYWSGHFSASPLPELLVQLPVTIVRQALHI